MTTTSPISALTLVGLEGGMGWESSAAYYRVIIQEIRRRLRGIRLAVCRSDALDVADVEPFVKMKN